MDNWRKPLLLLLLLLSRKGGGGERERERERRREGERERGEGGECRETKLSLRPCLICGSFLTLK